MPKHSAILSVVIPFRNREGRIERAIDSILDQERSGTEVEILAVNDRSTDGGPASVLERFGDRVVLLDNFRQPGAQGARNSGLERSQGEILAFLDSDDIWLPGILKSHVHAIQNGADFHCTGWIEEENGVQKAMKIPQHGPSRAFSGVLARPGPMFQGMALRRELLSASGLLDEETPSHQEWDASLMFLEKSTASVFTDEPGFLYYRPAVGGVSNSGRNSYLGYRHCLFKRQYAWNLLSNAEINHHFRSLLRRGTMEGMETVRDDFMRISDKSPGDRFVRHFPGLFRLYRQRLRKGRL